MPTMTCPPAEQLKAFYLGKLPDERSEELVAHVGGCSVCQAELETVIDAEDSLIADLRAEDGDQSLDIEPACELGMIRALGALAEANTSGVEVERGESESLPKRIGEYEILRALGQGGMGRVYLAKHSKLGRLVALKILAGSRLGDRRASERFEAEMRAIGRLSHSNIVTAHDAREVDGVAVLVTEFVDGFDLGELLRRTGPLDIADVCEIVRRVAVALQYTSDQGFVHRDVKPSNIMLSNSGEVKLLDLGLARLQYGDGEVTEFTATGQTMGTADYISPEQVRDSRTVDIRSDIYSLGATLFKLLVGRAPFADEKHSTAFAKMTAHVSMVPARVRSLRSEVPEELSQLVAAMLAKEPDGRPQRPEVVAKKLAAFAAGHNLESLAQRAATVDTKRLTHVVSPPMKTELRTQPVWYRPVKLYVAIAAGFVGMLLGLCLGIIITIKNPDGSKTVMQLPPGSKVEVSEGEGDAVPDDTASMDAARFFQWGTKPLLEFGLILDGPMQTESWYGYGVRFLPVAEDVEVPKSMLGAEVPANKLALLSLNPKLCIRADELWGHVLETKIVKSDDADAIEFTFDESLSKRMSELTTAHAGQQLAIIVEGKVVAAPRIIAAISSKAIITGKFSAEQLQRLQGWLNAAKPVAMSDVMGKGTETAATFNGNSLDRWLELLRTEASRNGQLAAVAGLKGLMNKKNSDQILNAVLSVVETRKTQCAEELELIREILGPQAYGKWLINQLDKHQIEWTKAILRRHTDNTWKNYELRPEHCLIAKWLADPRNRLQPEEIPSDVRDLTIQQCVEQFLEDLFFHSDVTGEALDDCFLAARNQTAIGDANTFLLGIPTARGLHAASRFPEDARLYKFADLAVETLVAEAPDVRKATRAMAILIAYPNVLRGAQVSRLTEVTNRRFEAMLKDHERIGEVVDRVVERFMFIPATATQDRVEWNWHPDASRGSEALSLLYFAVCLGSPAELESSVTKLRELTQPKSVRATEVWKEWTAGPTWVQPFEWPFDDARSGNEEFNKQVIATVGPKDLRAAYFDVIAEAVQRSFARRSRADKELAGSEATAFVGIAMQHFARIERNGKGTDFQMQDLLSFKRRDKVADEVLQTMMTDFKTIDQDDDSRITVAEYARYLAGQAKKDVHSSGTISESAAHSDTELSANSAVLDKARRDSGTMRGASMSTEERQIASDFGAAVADEPVVEFDHRRVHRAIAAFALCLHGDRTAPITDTNLEQLATAITWLDPSRRTKQDSVKRVITKSWPFHGVKAVLPGTPPDASWLTSEGERSFTLVIDPQAILPSVRTLVDELVGQEGVFDDIVKGLAEDPTGPRLDLREVIDYLGNEMVVCVGAPKQLVAVYAFSLKNPEAMQSALKNYNDQFDAIKVVNNYLVLGSKDDVELVLARLNPAPQRTAADNLKMLGLAFENFESTYRKLPGSKNYREGGIGFKGPRAKHPFSWRVAILPFVEQAELFQQYDFNEPWDSEKNLKLLDKMPVVFRSPHAQSDQKVGETNYLGFAGEKSAMGGEGGVPMAEIKDGTSATVLLVETKRTVPWTKPEDFAFAEYVDAKRAEPFDGLGLNCIMVDGTVLSLDAPVDWERLGRLVTRDGGEPLEGKKR